MLISLSRKFIFVANLKSASTSIESALADYAEIRLTRSEWQKHMSLSVAETMLRSVAPDIPFSDFFCFGVIRNPVDWLASLYRSHKSIKFENTPLSTAGMSFGQFFRMWCSDNHDMARTQVDRFRDLSGEIAINFVIDYDHIHRDFALVLQKLNLPQIELPWENKSPDSTHVDDVDAELLTNIRNRYQVDFVAHEKCLAGSINENKVREVDFVPADILLSTPEPIVDSASPNAPQLTEDDVVWAFRYILGRDPESNSVIQTHLGCGSRDALRQSLLKSEEFRNYIHLN